MRENTEGEYSSVGGRMFEGTDREVVIQETVMTRVGIDRVLRFAFELARQRPRKRLTSATKSNGISITMPYWDERVAAMAAEYPDVTVDQFHIDILTANFVLHPDWFDVVVASNLFGDILSDLGPACTGTIGIAPSANINPTREFPSLFEPVHGSAPDIAGRGHREPDRPGVVRGDDARAPRATRRPARPCCSAIERVLERGTELTPDLGGSGTTSSLGDRDRRGDRPEAVACGPVAGRLVEKLDGFQRRRRWAGFPLAVVYKFADDQGSYLAALIAYYGFLSLFPLLLLLVTILGFVLQNDAQLQEQLLDSALAQFPVIGSQLRDNVRSLTGSGAGLALGILLTLYGCLGVAGAAQNAFNRAWAVPRNRRPNPIKARLRSLLLLPVLGLGIIVTTGLAGLTTSANAYGADLGAALRVLAILLAVVANIGLFMIIFRVLTASQVPTRDLRIGAVAAGVGWQAVQVLGHVLRDQHAARSQRGLWRLRPRARADRVDLPAGAGPRARRRDQRRRAAAPVAARAADAVHRRRPAHGRRRARVHGLRRQRAAQGLRGHRRRVRPAREDPDL